MRGDVRKTDSTMPITQDLFRYLRPYSGSIEHSLLSELFFKPDDTVKTSDVVIYLGSHNQHKYSDCTDVISKAALIDASAHILTGGTTLADMAGRGAVLTEARLMLPHVQKARTKINGANYIIEGPDISALDAVRALSVSSIMSCHAFESSRPFVLLENRAMNTPQNFRNIIELFPMLPEVNHVHLVTLHTHRCRAEMTMRAVVQNNNSLVTFSSFGKHCFANWQNDFSKADLVANHGAPISELARIVEYGLKGDIVWGNKTSFIHELVEIAQKRAMNSYDQQDSESVSSVQACVQRADQILNAILCGGVDSKKENASTVKSISSFEAT